MIRHVHSHEQAPRQAANGTIWARVRRSPEQPQDDLLDLQRRFGNAAVTELVQRAPRYRAASTDVADVSGGKKHHGRAAKPPPKKSVADIHARVIKYDFDQGQGLITIASGPDQGVQVGMSGSLVLSNGTEYADFTIEKAKGSVSSAHVQAIADQVRANPQALIKASSFSSESMAGKEF
jgi:hypothetical protein